MRHVIIAFALLILFLASCSKPITGGTGSRTDPANPEGISITLDTTWHNDTLVPF